jgi:hypothetical protein
LQRSWVALGQGWAAPLDKSRVFRCMYLISPSSHVALNTQLQSMVCNVSRELFMHGREDYDKFLAALPRERPLPDGSMFTAPKLPTYDELMLVW